MKTLLHEGINFEGNYQFQQLKPPDISTSGGRTKMSVMFGGAAPLYGAFIEQLRRGIIPSVTAFGINTANFSLEEFSGDGDPQFPKVSISLTRQDVIESSSKSTQTITTTVVGYTVQFQYRAATTTKTWLAIKRPNKDIPKYSGVSSTLNPWDTAFNIIISDSETGLIVTDSETIDSTIASLRSINPPQVTIDQYDITELVVGRLWECSVTCMRKIGK